jgi:hypothetical protein
MKTKYTLLLLIASLASQPLSAVVLQLDTFEDEPVGTFTTAVNSTNYRNTSDNTFERIAIVANGSPSGKSMGISGNGFKHITSASPLDLTSFDSVTVTLDLNFAGNFNLGLYYSNNNGASYTLVNNFLGSNYTANTWHTGQSFTLAETAVAGGFTSNSRFLWNTNSGANNWVYMDNIQVVGIPEPAAALLGGLGLLTLLRRRR